MEKQILHYSIVSGHSPAQFFKFSANVIIFPLALAWPNPSRAYPPSDGLRRRRFRKSNQRSRDSRRLQPSEKSFSRAPRPKCKRDPHDRASIEFMRWFEFFGGRLSTEKKNSPFKFSAFFPFFRVNWLGTSEIFACLFISGAIGRDKKECFAFILKNRWNIR